MKSTKNALLFGFIVWLVPFIVSILIWPIHESNRPLFESIMPVVGVIVAVKLSYFYFKKVSKSYVAEGVRLGLIWMSISLILDLFMFISGPFKMSLGVYISDIGVTYLLIPVLTVGFAKILEDKKK